MLFNISIADHNTYEAFEEIILIINWKRVLSSILIRIKREILYKYYQFYAEKPHDYNPKERKKKEIKTLLSSVYTFNEL